MDGQSENMQVDLSEALAQDGQLIITNEDGNGNTTLCASLFSWFKKPHFSLPSWHQRNDNATGLSANVSVARAAANKRQHRLRHTDAGTEFHFKQ